MSYESKLIAMKKNLKKRPATKKETPIPKPERPFYTEQWERAGLKAIDNAFGTVFVREVHYPMTYVHGKYPLHVLKEAIARWQNTTHPIGTTQSEQLVFYDTETTGLKGVGTYIFLNGLLTMTETDFVLKQFVLANPSHEEAFLYESKLWQKDQTIVTYNGKSFDWPQLETRWTLHRNKLPLLPKQRQIDLMHSAKRIWKKELPNMKLSEIERSKLGFHRHNDVPGYLAPPIYLDAVRSGETNALMTILKHNEYDLLSLITLYIEVSALLTTIDGGETANTYTNIGKWYKDLKEPADSMYYLDDVTNSYNQTEAGEAYFLKGFLLKKQQQFEEAYESFEKSVHHVSERQRIEAYVELAKLSEHQFRHIRRAISWTERAISELQRATCFKESTRESHLQKQLHRMQRLQNKLC